MATAIEKDVCSVCLGKYVKPRTLPCQHSFCHLCLVECFKRINGNQRFYCPFCRTDTKTDTSSKINVEKTVECFPINLSLIKRMNAASTNSDAHTNFCKPCLRDKTHELASVYCFQCSEKLCIDCKKHHSKNKLTSCHTVVDIASDSAEAKRLNFVKNLTKCKKHPLEEVNYLCKDHDQLCCNECAIMVHRKCKCLQSLGDCVTSDFQKCVTENLEIMEKSIENMKMHEANHRKSVCNSEVMIKDQLLCIKAEFDYAFHDFGKSILQKVRSKCNGFRNSISSQQMSIDKFEADIKYSKDKKASVELYGQDLHKYLMEREMEEEMEQNKQVLKSLHQTTNRSEISLAGVNSISKQLIECLQQNLSITEYVNDDILPEFPTLIHRNTGKENGSNFINHIASNIKKRVAKN